MRTLLAFLFLMTGLSPALTTQAYAAERTIVVLDASGSMWGQIGGKAKIEIARETLSTVLKSVPASTELGLMVYGHREKGSCSDIELAVPPKKGSAGEILSFAKKITPKGKTPLSDAVKQAAEALRYTEEKATVVLVTDGLETCNADPCALGTELKKSGVDFTVHVVGLGLTKGEGEQVACLAENTGGKYFDASSAAKLASALTETVAAPPKEEPKPLVKEEPKKVEYNVVTDATLAAGGPSMGKNDNVHWMIFEMGPQGERGKQLDHGYGAVQKFSVVPGRYLGVAELGRMEETVQIEAKATDVAKPVINFDAAEIVVTPKRGPTDTDFDRDARVDALYGDKSDGGYGRTDLFVKAGDVKLVGSLDGNKAEQTITVKAGDKVEHDLVIGTGLVLAKAIYADGGEAVNSTDIRFDVMSVKKDIQGNRQPYGGTYGPVAKIDTPTGDLMLVGKLGSATAELPFSIKAGEQQELTVNLNAGVLVVNNPGGRLVEVLSPKKDIEGKRKTISYNYTETFQDTLPAGDYVVHVTYEGDKAEAEKPVTIKAGERAELKFE